MRIRGFHFVEYFDNCWIETFCDCVVGSRDGAVKIGYRGLVGRSLLFGFPRLLFHRGVGPGRSSRVGSSRVGPGRSSRVGSEGVGLYCVGG